MNKLESIMTVDNVHTISEYEDYTLLLVTKSDPLGNKQIKFIKESKV